MWGKLALVLALVAAPLTTAKSDTLTVGQAKTTALADWYANIHYAALAESGEVVITIAPGADAAGRPMRVVSRLADGQSQTISIGGHGESTLHNIDGDPRGRSSFLRCRQPECLLGPEDFRRSCKLSLLRRAQKVGTAIRARRPVF